MGIFSTLTSFGVGYVAGAMTGPRAKQRLSATVEQLPDATKERLPERLTNAIGDVTVDVRSIREVMTEHPRTVSLSSTLQDAARMMAEDAIGNVIVDDAVGRVAGILTDRDLAIRATAQGLDPTTATVEQAFTPDISTLGAHRHRAGRRAADAREGHPPAPRGRGRQGDRHRLARRHLDPDRARVGVVGHQRRDAGPLTNPRPGPRTGSGGPVCEPGGRR